MIAQFRKTKRLENEIIKEKNKKESKEKKTNLRTRKLLRRGKLLMEQDGIFFFFQLKNKPFKIFYTTLMYTFFFSCSTLQ